MAASSDSASHEKGRAERIEPQHARLIYAKRGFLSFLGRRSRQGHPVCDISRSGVRFLTDEKLKARQHLSVALKLRSEDPPVHFDAEVVRTERDEERDAYSVVVRCTGYSDQSWHRLWEFIDASTKDSKGSDEDGRVPRGKAAHSHDDRSAAP